MPTFTFTPQYNENPPEGVERDCATPEAAIREARSFMAEIVADQSKSIQCASVGVGEGALSTEDVEWLGAWDWSGDCGWTWTPDD